MPLYTPEHFKNYNILAIDPGLNRTGISIYGLDMTKSVITDITSFTLVNEKLPDEIEFEELYHPERVFKLYRLKHAFTNVLLNYRPIAVVSESPFYSSFRPSAYASLVEVISHLHDCVINCNPNTLFRSVEPMVVKKTIGASLSSNKGSVKDAVMGNKTIMDVMTIDINSLDEHAIDSIAVGYTFLKNYGDILL